jgi:hypothetical protein
MKIFAAGLAFAVAAAAPIMAQAKAKPHPRTSVHHHQAAVPAHAGAPRAQVFNPAWVVYHSDGTYAGADPDPLIRTMLRRDYYENDP